jgi:uncharacterized protein (DUF2235 family)
MLVIRGSQSSMDWSINFEEALVDFNYTSVLTKPTASSSHAVQSVHGVVHKGIYCGAMGILDGYGVRLFLMMLFNSGFVIHCVGHSLGAGVASIVAAELRNDIVLQALQRKSIDQTEMTTDVKAVDIDKPAEILDEISPIKAEKITVDVQRVDAVVFSCPAIVSLNIAAAFAQDRLLINVINGPDIIPRLSRHSMGFLAKEMNDFRGQAEEWTALDKKDLTSYIKKMGKASDIQTSSSRERTMARYNKVFQRLQAAKTEKDSTAAIANDNSDDEPDNVSIGSSQHDESSSSMVDYFVLLSLLNSI